MAKAKKVDVVEEVAENPVVSEQKVIEQGETNAVEPEKQEEKRTAKKAAAQEEEIEFLNVHDVYRPAQDGTVAANEDGIHLVVIGADGRKYALPYNKDAHKELREGDKLRF